MYTSSYRKEKKKKKTSARIESNFALEGNVKEEATTTTTTTTVEETTSSAKEVDKPLSSAGDKTMAEPVSFVLGETEDDAGGEELAETGDSFPGDKIQHQTSQQGQQNLPNGLLERRRRLR